MLLQQTKAVVLSVKSHGEADKIVTFYGRQTGKLNGIAKGAQRSRIRFVNKLELFSLLDLSYQESHSSGLVRIDQAELLQPFAAIRGSYPSYTAASLVAELMGHWTREADPDPAVFTLLVWTLDTIDGSRAGGPPNDARSSRPARSAQCAQFAQFAQFGRPAGPGVTVGPGGLGGSDGPGGLGGSDGPGGLGGSDGPGGSGGLGGPMGRRHGANARQQAAATLATVIFFELRLLALLGYRPDLDACLACHNPAPPGRGYHFSLAGGGLLCPRCNRQSQQLIPLSLATTRILARAQELPLAKLTRLRLPPASAREALNFLHHYSRHLLQKETHARACLLNIYNSSNY